MDGICETSNQEEEQGGGGGFIEIVETRGAAGRGIVQRYTTQHGKWGIQDL